RQINRESFLLLGGTAALLMQVAHPLVAAGVDQHSDFRRSPVRRLLRTVDTTLAIVFGERATAQSALKRIGRSHAPVRGQAANGRAVGGTAAGRSSQGVRLSVRCAAARVLSRGHRRDPGAASPVAGVADRRAAGASLREGDEPAPRGGVRIVAAIVLAVLIAA